MWILTKTLKFGCALVRISKCLIPAGIDSAINNARAIMVTRDRDAHDNDNTGDGDYEHTTN